MKKLKLLVASFALALSSNAQTIGDHLNYFQREEPDGLLETISTGYTYTVVDNNLTIYFFGYDLVCSTIAIRPRTPEGRQSWMRALNQSWTQTSLTTWTYLRDNGSILECEVSNVDEVGVVFWITEIKSEI
jgi:hypothetical protein